MYICLAQLNSINVLARLNLIALTPLVAHLSWTALTCISSAQTDRFNAFNSSPELNSLTGYRNTSINKSLDTINHTNIYFQVRPY